MSIHYSYNGHITQVNLQALAEEISENISSSYILEGSIWNQGCNTTQKPPCTSDCLQPCNGLLVIIFHNALSTEDKAILDDIVSHY